MGEIRIQSLYQQYEEKQYWRWWAPSFRFTVYPYVWSHMWVSLLLFLLLYHGAEPPSVFPDLCRAIISSILHNIGCHTVTNEMSHSVWTDWPSWQQDGKIKRSIRKEQVHTASCLGTEPLGHEARHRNTTGRGTEGLAGGIISLYYQKRFNLSWFIISQPVKLYEEQATKTFIHQHDISFCERLGWLFGGLVSKKGYYALLCTQQKCFDSWPRDHL